MCICAETVVVRPVDGGDDTVDCRSHISVVFLWPALTTSKILSLTYVRRGCHYSIHMDNGMTRIHWKGDMWEGRSQGLLIVATRTSSDPYRFSEENESS